METARGKKKTLKEIKGDLINFFKNREEVLLVYLFGILSPGKILEEP